MLTVIYSYSYYYFSIRSIASKWPMCTQCQKRTRELCCSGDICKVRRENLSTRSYIENVLPKVATCKHPVMKL